ncbi:MAG: 16S rRNA (adenine(1518)-N(6)/adenine(1519)-N(6))-dimethyltransferase RsmA [Brevibacterium sp.]|uniref:16S rRNA (adenine(1518)-N(6)/adenine(1519)-N(6))- dimethyltransferase RsmA n=1 Tax=Brevibacterium sp. TaxID=1701 RepID=UPI002648F9DD|nr:16S rRNA (adenine(1518)-N(6)/adenine(1519)-N(6))-dimethyltransferase RsmA [Brevibacterium sp.]MDN5805914.1 16S rRNA (adenine(1518)-N(6)/adenine(1519)-N(6))-dimethyltransferase RsmA [Brevibacterium sp.]MDN5834952.1 16S rRNA (adenine(1518)-N(6)/adenine(1519)-N(6))-dimethyltransferase RsmA [Brevibacterium sp.]MDN5875446.1 16S rRNA (adenine(1518)-N(6)/adenine(1519)-N(6))-dimethyltransferase RsmA [Brevibacterium sp.]MDN5908869.1 16S rRNA (adenine(1518)-N(6)/adenine(1519)-N(6))-dimethyltransferase
MTLLTARDIREIAADIGLRPTKQKGQNFVIDPNTVRSIVTSAKLQGHSRVVEIGPGLGSLTLGLLEAGHHVTAVEIDDVLAARLPATVSKYGQTSADTGDVANFELVNADALRVTELPSAPDALVANLPYNVAVPVLLHFLEIFPSLQSVLVMVQLEVAERLAAGPGSRTYGVPSVKAQWYGDVTLAGRIGKNVFWPAPNIDSGLVHIDVTRTHRDPHQRRRLFNVVDAAFAQRRKTLRAALATWAGSPQQAEELLHAAGIDPRTRGEALDVADFERLAAAGEGADSAAAPDTAAPGGASAHEGQQP